MPGHSRFILQPALALAGLVCCLLLFGCRTPPAKVSSTHFLMDTLVGVDAYAISQKDAEISVRQAFSRMREIDALTDRYSKNPASDCTRINDAAGHPVKVSGDLFFLAGYVLEKKWPEVNIAVGPLVDLWSVNTRKTAPPPRDIAKTSAFVRTSKLTLDREKQTACLSPAGASLDFGAVAKGYAVDQAAAILGADKNLTGVLINGGGNIKVLGEKPDGQPWQIGIQDPRAPGALLGVLKLPPGTAVATSGDYQRYFEAGGRRYHHIINPADGYPAAENISVTVLARTALDADYYSTLLFLLPAQKALALLPGMPDIQAIIVSGDKTVYVSAGLKENFTPERKGGWQYVQK